MIAIKYPHPQTFKNAFEHLGTLIRQTLLLLERQIREIRKKRVNKRFFNFSGNESLYSIIVSSILKENIVTPYPYLRGELTNVKNQFLGVYRGM
jgi:hypothetical protein